MIDAWMSSREWDAKAPRTRADYSRGLRDIRSKFGAWDARKLINDPDLADMVLTWIEKRGWAGKEADCRLDAFKFLVSWLNERKRSRFPTNHLRGVRKFYRALDRSSVVWTDDEVTRFVAHAPERSRTPCYSCATPASAPATWFGPGGSISSSAPMEPRR